MIKTIQTIALTAIVFSPLSLISLVTAATAHHSSSHVSNISIADTKTRKKGAKKVKPPAATGTSEQKPAPDAMTQPPATMPGSESVPVKPTPPDTSIDKMNPSGVVTPKPGSSDIPPAGNLPSNPSVPGTPSIPGTPSVPGTPASGSSTPTTPTTLPSK